MKIKLLFLLSLITAYTAAQKIRWDDLNVRTTVQPSLFLKENPLDVGVICTSSDQEFFANQSLQYNIGDNVFLYNDYISNNLGFPKLVAVLEYKYAAATLHVIKKDLKYQVVVVSHIYANLLLIDPDKGVFDTQEMKLGDCDLVNPISNIKGFNSNLGNLDYPNNLNTTLVIADLSEFEANQYKDKSNSSLPRVIDGKSVDDVQLLKLKLKIGSLLRGKFLVTNRYVKRAFNYLKEDKDFSGDNFNKASQLINSSLDPVDESKLRDAIVILNEEASSILDLEEKKNKKYYIAIQENILQCYNVLRDFSITDDIANNLKKYDSNNQIADALISNKKGAAVPKQSAKEIVYNAVPARFISSDLTRFLGKKEGFINAIPRLVPDKYDGKLRDMSEFYTASVAFKSAPVNSDNFNNLVSMFIDLAEAERSGSNHSQVREVKEVLSAYNTFCVTVGNERKKFADSYDFKKEAAFYITRLREHILSLHKKEEFLVFNDALSTAITSTIEHTKSENKSIAQDFIDLNTALRFKQILNNAKYDVTIQRTLANITAFLDKKFPSQQLEVFYEFKNASKVIKEKKVFTTVELANFSNILTILYTYV
jgi:hypothetical protein